MPVVICYYSLYLFKQQLRQDEHLTTQPSICLSNLDITRTAIHHSTSLHLVSRTNLQSRSTRFELICAMYSDTYNHLICITLIKSHWNLYHLPSSLRLPDLIFYWTLNVQTILFFFFFFYYTKLRTTFFKRTTDNNKYNTCC